jgi:hypothetical protein
MWLERTLSPQLTVSGIALRDGQWGTIMPAGLDGQWLAAEWHPASPKQCMASAARSTPK